MSSNLMIDNYNFIGPVKGTDLIMYAHSMVT